jgi:hypothetical protein
LIRAATVRERGPRASLKKGVTLHPRFLTGAARIAPPRSKRTQYQLLNQDVKSNALGRQRPPDKPALLAGVRAYLRSTQRQPSIVRSYFQEKHVRYAAG